MNGLLPLWALPLSWSCAENPVSKEHCELGMAVTADGEAHPTLARAVARAIELDGVVDVCPGRHEVEGRVDTTRAASVRPVTIRGGGVEVTTLVAVGNGLSGGAPLPTTLSELTIERSNTAWTGDECTTPGESDRECDSPFDHDGYPEGALRLAGSWHLDEVAIVNNNGYWGGAVTVTYPSADESATVSFENSHVVGNVATDSSGGALLVAHDEYFGQRGELTITSTNTDWGAGETDNTPDDIAFASWDGYFHDSLTVHASYSFDGVADFACNADTYTCE